MAMNNQITPMGEPVTEAEALALMRALFAEIDNTNKNRALPDLPPEVRTLLDVHSQDMQVALRLGRFALEQAVAVREADDRLEILRTLKARQRELVRDEQGRIIRMIETALDA